MGIACMRKFIDENQELAAKLHVELAEAEDGRRGCWTRWSPTVTAFLEGVFEGFWEAATSPLFIAFSLALREWRDIAHEAYDAYWDSSMPAGQEHLLIGNDI